ncbi:MAG: TRAP transporter small permease [Kofleriaceae bacterium]
MGNDEDTPKPDLPVATVVAAAETLARADAAAAAEPGVEPPEPPLSRRLRQVDEAIGTGERVAMTAVFAFLVVLGFYRTLADVLFHQHDLWAVEGIRVSVFAIAMLGAAFATHHKRNFSLDLLSKALSPAGRAVLRITLNLIALLAAGLLAFGGWQVKKILAHETHYELVPKWMIGWFVPLAAGLIIAHLVLHTLIELDYLARGRTAPEPEQAVA